MTYRVSLPLLIIFTSLCTIAATSFAGTVIVPNNFSSGTPAVANEVNANFTAVKISVDDNDARIAALEAGISRLQNTVSNLRTSLSAANATIATLQNNLNAVQSNSVLALDGMLLFTTDANGYATIQFTGVNVQVINGVDQNTINGLGNFIVGYNNAAPRTVGFLTCSDGQYVDPTICREAGEIWALDHKSGSHNLVVGTQNNYSRYGGVVFGKFNSINRNYATVTGGWFNTASGGFSSVSGGALNIASGSRSSVGGGEGNTASGRSSSVSGGNNRSVTGEFNWAAGSLFETQ